MELKGYKGFNKDLTCRGFQYEIGKEYKHEGDIELCDKGFHFCKRLMDIHGHYNLKDEDVRVCEVIASGNIIEGDDECVTDNIKIVRELSKEEIEELKNIGKENTGISNAGNWNTGDYNAGDWNTGDWNTGDYNTGDYNAGYRNTGDWNTGDRNTGYRNTGDYNTGNWNTGDWNITDRATGCFCTEIQTMNFFDKKSTITWEEWRNSEAYYILRRIPKSVWVDWEDMTEEEQKQNPKAETTRGFMRELDLKEEAKKWWANLNDREKETIRNMPNYDIKKFRKIMGGAKIG